jgi:hypothetical protein
MAPTAQNIDPSKLPSSTRERFGFLYTIVCFITIWSGSISLYNLSYGLLNVGLPDDSLRRVAVGAITMAAALLIAACLYLVHPLLRVRKFGKTKTLDSTSLPASQIAKIAKAIGVASPQVVVDADIHHVDALAFGLPGKRCLLLGRGLLLLFLKRPREFDLRIAHELAHIKSGDVDLGYIARAMTHATKIILSSCLLVWLLSFARWTWQQWTIAVTAGSNLTTFLNWYLPAAGWNLSYSAITLLWVLCFWWALISVEYRSFLRSREYYADVLATGMTSIANLATAVGNSRGNALAFREVLAAHPSPSSRLEIATHPERLVQPRLPYFSFIGFVCGVVQTGVVFSWGLFARAFPSIDTSIIYQTHKTYYDMVNDPAVRALFALQTGFYLVLVFPFVAALGSLGVRACLGELLSRSLYITAARNLGLQSIVFFCSFAFGTFLNPFALQYVRFQFQQTGSWTIDIDWGNLISVFNISTGAMYSIAYFLTTLLFMSGIRASLFGRREVVPPTIWRIFIILLWTYVYLLLVEMVWVAFDAAFNPAPAIPQHFLLVLMMAVLSCAVGLCWGILWLVARTVARRGLTSPANYKSEFAPWLYLNPARVP